jgi:hypothetical protein
VEGSCCNLSTSTSWEFVCWRLGKNTISFCQNSNHPRPRSEPETSELLRMRANHSIMKPVNDASKTEFVSYWFRESPMNVNAINRKYSLGLEDLTEFNGSHTTDLE